MKEYLVVDGYNIINSWTDIFDTANEPLEDCRTRLIDMLANYQGYKKINVIVVFDAHMIKGGTRKIEKHAGLEVVYTKEDETADHYIERFVYQMPSKYNIRVATSDYLEQIIVLNSGGVRMTSRELKEEVKLINKKIREKIEKKPEKMHNIMSQVPEDIVRKLEKLRRDKF